MTGYAHPMVFKAITNTEISKVETFVRERALAILQQNIHDSINEENCEVVIDDEQLREYFGDLYVQDTSSFQFESGDLLLIKELVDHVKSIADANGKNTGLGHFMSASKKRGKQQKKANLFPEKKKKVVVDFDMDQLKMDLQQKVRQCFNSHMVDMEVNSVQDDQIAVELCVKKGQLFGDVFCIICATENRKNQKPKSVYYKSDKYGCWVLSNLVTHLQKVHHLKAQVNKFEASATEQIVDRSETDHLDYSDEHDSSCVIVMEHGLKQKNNIKTDDAEELFKQLSTQITKVMAAILSTEGTSTPNRVAEIQFALCEAPRKLTVALIPGDGSCLFGALAHQLFMHDINSQDHIEATKKLRADVVEYILKPENYPSFEYHIKDRVYEIKNQKEIKNMTSECKFYVRHVLSNHKTFGGVETLYAVSNLYSTNVVVFTEDGVCTKYKKADQTYDRSIAVVHCYRYGANAQKTLNHFDSVAEMTGADMLAAARFILK